MSRDEEINQVTDAYMGDYVADMFGACVEDVAQAFRDGIEWADEHPVNVWHDASEEPAGDDWRILLEGKNGKEWRILLDGKNGKHWVTSRYCISLYFDNWQKFTEDDALTRWAYVSDLLPKGGE